MKKVLLVHGIGSSGAWFESVRWELEPHFECCQVRYGQYERLGAVKVLVGIGIFKQALASVRAQFELYTSMNPTRPHLIAHSFGTVLTAFLMRSLPFVRFDRIIFAGSALSWRFPWSSILEEDPTKFESLRNEVGGRDVVAMAAGVAGLVRRGLGLAGWAGFQGAHCLKGPRLPCSQCEGTLSRIHDAPLREYGHSGVFLSPRHARELWLPWLWGFWPDEFSRLYIDPCFTSKGYRDLELHLEAEQELAPLRSWRWEWIRSGEGPIEFGDYVGLVLLLKLDEHGIEPHSDEVDGLVNLALRGVSEAVVTAWLEQQKAPSLRRSTIAQALHPRIAARRAVDRLVEDLVLPARR